MFRLLSLILIAAFAVGASPLPAYSAEAAATRSHEKAIQVPQGKFVQELGDKAIKIVADKQMGSEKRSAEFTKILGEDFDLKTIGRFVIGRTWNMATPQQQAEYLDLFKALVLRAYGSRMSLYTGEGFEVIGTRPESELDTTVISQITHPDGSQPTQIDWRVREKDGKMGVVDVIVEGVSLSITQKQEYASVIQNNGGQIDGLLQTMRDQLKTRTADGKQ
ncbi:MAG: ABC transporter substrate-binding protein [Alphaproteobacteria bacterium]|nr:ABC transporter substrate-binding protein [Alphaproteobacteria bacterium]